jgi:HPt (histidine-containing phosphotransfer) domain-containing protein
MIGKAEEFMKDGFDGFMSKPIQTKNLNSILIKYVKNKQPPEVIEAAQKASAENPVKKRDIHSFQKSPELLEKLRADFVRGHRDTYSKLLMQLDDGDIETAHRTAHTIKGAAGLIYEHKLLEAAFDVEQRLKMRRQPTKQDLLALEQELERVLSDIGETKTEKIAESEMMDKAGALALLEKVAPLLSDRNADIVNMLDELRKVPDSADLCRQIQDFDFASAYETVLGMLGELR